MNVNIELAARQNFARDDLDAMHRLRARVFADRLGWEVDVIDGMEIDCFDRLDPHYMLVRIDGTLRGCWRLLPTVGPYMLADTFPELLEGRPAPRHPRVWELSRFVLDTVGRPDRGFADPTIMAMQRVVGFAAHMGIDRYVTVTTVSMERMLTKLGLEVLRCGDARLIGRVRTVAIELPMGPAAAAALAQARGASRARLRSLASTVQASANRITPACDAALPATTAVR